MQLHLLFQPSVNSRNTPFIKNDNNNKKKLSYPLPLSINEDIIKYNIAKMTSTSKGYIPYALAIIIK